MPFEKPVHALLENQIDCDVIPSDVFAETDFYGTKLSGDRLVINKESYRVLVIPYCQCIPSPAAKFLCMAAKSGFPIIFVDGIPEKVIDMDAKEEQAVRNIFLSRCKVVPLAELVCQIHNLKIEDISVSTAVNGLRYYHYQKPHEDLYMFFNEKLQETLEVTVKLPVHTPAYQYDAFSNTLRNIEATYEDGWCRLPLKLSPYESCVIVFDQNHSFQKMKIWPTVPQFAHTIRLEGAWKLSLADRRTYPVFSDGMKQNELEDITAIHLFPKFSGTAWYETSFYMEKEVGCAALDLGEVYETAEVWINGKQVGEKIAPPYIFHLSGLLQKGENVIRVEVTNTMVHEEQDEISKLGSVNPSGLLGPVRIFY